MSPRKQRRQPGSSGGAYQNRTDLTQPVSLPTNLPYGERQQLEQAQQGLPLPQTAPTPTPGVDPAIAAAQAHSFQPTQLNAPTDRPHEPVTHGLPSGPGAGPEALGYDDSMAMTLQRLAQSTGNVSIAAMAQRAAQYQV